MLDISPEKLLVVVTVALAVLGPQGVPRLARGLGKARAEIRRLTADVPPEALQAITNPRGALLDAVSGPRHAVTQALAEPRLALADAIADFKLTGAAPSADLPAGAHSPAAADPPAAARLLTSSDAPTDRAPIYADVVEAVPPDDPGLN